MSDAEDWQELLGALYASVMDLDGAEAKLPGLIARWTGGATVALWTVDGQMRPTAPPVTNGPAEGAAKYAEHYHVHDPWRPRFVTDRSGRVSRGSEVISDAALRRSVYYNEFGKAFGTFHIMNTMFALPHGEERLFGSVSVMRDQHKDGFSDEEVARLVALAPHLRQATTLRAQLAGAAAQAAASTLAALVDGLRLPACILSGDGRVVHANPEAERLARQGGGIVLGDGRNGLRFRVARGTEQVRQAAADVARGGPGRTLLIQVADGRPLQASITPVGEAVPPGFLPRPGVALMVLRPVGAAPEPVLEELGMQLFGFTRAEAGAAAALAAGHVPQAIAAMRGTRVSTVRTLLERAQVKAGAADLRQLVARLASLSV